MEEATSMHRAKRCKVEKQFEDFEDFIRTILQEWKVPGVAVAIIQDGEILLSQGFGLRNLADGLEVTPETLFSPCLGNWPDPHLPFSRSLSR
jgi:CubicO group peptidase (beta-lactamase class C family)